ncbi:pyridoxal phosphate-dependent transferase [Calycina marina]|uniref:Pyridoxal phosphate-dependent transferase n=1 Tax=Calycina marina TaxID=1763456 RepID=A0A9P7Z6H2_9HELO|nr:pyridoxal phosphate-dependent transferase [Calycina marina]
MASNGPSQNDEQHMIGEGHIFSHHTAPDITRFEAVLSSILKGPALTYSSGFSALHAALVLLNPKCIAILDGYHGCHGVIEVHQKLTGLKKLDLYYDASELETGDVVHVETPLNPKGQAGAFLVVDETFDPPPLQDPFLWGADTVMHSGTRYVGGHSDMLCVILAVNPERAKEGWFEGLTKERLFLGNAMGNMESWMGIRSVRTLEVRVKRQAFNAGTSGLVKRVVGKLDHASLQEQDIKDGWLLKRLPGKLALFHHATSLGGVESLIKWRSMTDLKVDTRLLRVSIGIEGELVQDP